TIEPRILIGEEEIARLRFDDYRNRSQRSFEAKWHGGRRDGETSYGNRTLHQLGEIRGQCVWRRHSGRSRLLRNVAGPRPHMKYLADETDLWTWARHFHTYLAEFS